MSKWLTSKEAGKRYGVGYKRVEYLANDGLIEFKQLIGKDNPRGNGTANLYSFDDCERYFTGRGVSIKQIVMYSPWTRAGLRELRL